MEVVKKLINSRKIRFGLVGIGNTLLNFIVLNTMFFVFMQSKLVSSIIATLCAVCISFFLNRNFVFRHHQRSILQPILFVAVTLSGVLLVQNGTFVGFTWLLKGLSDTIATEVNGLVGISLSKEFFDINISNALASLIVMVWNYNGYRLFVFNDKFETKSGQKVDDEEAVTLTA